MLSIYPPTGTFNHERNRYGTAWAHSFYSERSDTGQYGSYIFVSRKEF